MAKPVTITAQKAVNSNSASDIKKGTDEGIHERGVPIEDFDANGFYTVSMKDEFENFYPGNAHILKGE